MQDDPIIGREWGNYVVESKIGEGGMGAVYRLVHKKLPDTYAALKVLNARGTEHASARDRFDQEARVAAAIGKDRVAGVLDQGEFPDGLPYIVMNLIQGQSLADLLDETGPMRVLAALRIAYCVADTLVTAHAKQIVHRDIKPSNIMLTRTRDQEFAVTILDWGIAKARGDLQVAHTATAAVAGTLGYMAPETLLPKAIVDGRADVFSLGVTLYRMLAGTLPFPPITSADQVPAFVAFASRAPSIGQHRPTALDPVPRWLERTILRAVLPTQEDRPTMDKFREDLGKAITRLQSNPENRPQAGDITEGDTAEPDEDSRDGAQSDNGPDTSDSTRRSPPSTQEQKTALLGNGPRTKLVAKPARRGTMAVGAALILLLALSVAASIRKCVQPASGVDMKPSPDFSLIRPQDLSVSPPRWSELPDLGIIKPVKPVRPQPGPGPTPKSKRPSVPCPRNSTGALICPK